MLGVMALVPGLPTIPFLTLAVIVGMLAYSLHRHGGMPELAAATPAAVEVISVGVRHALFPVLALGASWAASSPTPFSAASRVIGLIAGPSSALRSLILE
jgi:hypothetical protein